MMYIRGLSAAAPCPNLCAHYGGVWSHLEIGEALADIARMRGRLIDTFPMGIGAMLMMVVVMLMAMIMVSSPLLSSLRAGRGLSRKKKHKQNDAGISG